MPAKPLTWEQCQEALDAYTECGTECAAAHKLGLPRATHQGRLRQARANGHIAGAKPLTYESLPPRGLTAEQLVEHRIREFELRKAYEDKRRLIKVKVEIEGPIGIWHFGDPHIDDDGTDIAALKQHSELIRSHPAVFGANVGDTSNNWVGRLARLWAEQGTNAEQAWQLVEWFINGVDWLYIIGGNHDGWSGAGDPIKWIQKGRSAPYMSSEIRLELQFPNKNTCRINARHDFAGHSQYNPAHGPMKATMFGVRDHIAIAGHKHISGEGIVKNPDDGSVCHAILVAGYKIYDRFAMEKGFRDQRISPGIFTLIDPRLPNTHPDFVTTFWDIERGIEVLNKLRRA